MMKRFLNMLAGNFHYRFPTAPMRGSDHVSRASPDAVQILNNSLSGAGTKAGEYVRMQPAIYNAVQVAVISTIHGAGTVSNSSGVSGPLIDPTYGLGDIPKG